MKEIIVNKNEAGQRMDKLLLKYLNKANKSFIYKMLRKKNIVLNGKKAAGNEILSIDDSIKIFLSDETYNKFSEKENTSYNDIPKYNLDIIYENEHVLFINKEAGVLSQKATKDDVSIVEYIIDYLIKNKSISEEELESFKPSVCNRLDRNTTGLICAGKSLIGLQLLTKCIRDRMVDKYYLTIVKGIVNEKILIDGYLYKDEKTNKAYVSNKKSDASSYIKTEYEPICSNGKITLLRVKLITGKPHQIRAHLASKGHFIIGDNKYGDKKVNEYFKNKYSLKYQLLHAYEMIFDDSNECKKLDIDNKVIVAPVNKIFNKICKEEALKIDGGN